MNYGQFLYMVPEATLMAILVRSMLKGSGSIR